MKYKVLDPNGVNVGGKLVEKGEVVEIPETPSLRAFLHFKQVEPVKAKPKEEKTEGKEPSKPEPSKPEDKKPEEPAK